MEDNRQFMASIVPNREYEISGSPPNNSIISNSTWQPNLIKLDLSRTGIVSLTASITRFVQLRRLALNNCKQLQEIPELPQNIEEVNARGCISLESFPQASKKFQFDTSDESLDKLIWLDLSGCHKLLKKLSNPVLSPSLRKDLFGPVYAGQEIPTRFSLLEDQLQNQNVANPNPDQVPPTFSISSHASQKTFHDGAGADGAGADVSFRKESPAAPVFPLTSKTTKENAAIIGEKGVRGFYRMEDEVLKVQKENIILRPSEKREVDQTKPNSKGSISLCGPRPSKKPDNGRQPNKGLTNGLWLEITGRVQHESNELKYFLKDWESGWAGRDGAPPTTHGWTRRGVLVLNSATCAGACKIGRTYVWTVLEGMVCVAVAVFLLRFVLKVVMTKDLVPDSVGLTLLTCNLSG
ncbi:hypothetical protein CJ030_MR1G029018 [Morella rubra]|uniref:Uncharacterized protein n=1 Tax=Morella rubra TaxID=262757 RepID=A0A6A1WPI1_9ROSI|nr:hypothetical protein CJ030_MR1G029018 [Morella rubra]